MAWVIGIREVRHVEVPRALDRHGPVQYDQRLEETSLPREAWTRLLHFHVALPQQRAPCGTHSRGAGRPGVLAWSRVYLLAPLAAYYSSYVPPMRFGAKPGPRGRRAA